MNTVVPLRMLSGALGVAAAVFLCFAALALDFPPLTGRVVDQADVITSGGRSDIEAKSRQLEDKSGIQLVVATVKSLQGSDIESYANQLFRHWKLGEAKKNNGILLLVAPSDRKVRIEVGYGVEGTLTDALSSVIITSAIVPRFKAGDFSGGIERGVDGIISVLSGDTADWQPKAKPASDWIGPGIVIVFFLIVLVIIVFGVINSTHSGTGTGAKRRKGLVFAPSPSGSSDWGSSSGSSSDSGSSDSGFSGGGGSSGGGGASGSW